MSATAWRGWRGCCRFFSVMMQVTIARCMSSREAVRHPQRCILQLRVRDTGLRRQTACPGLLVWPAADTTHGATRLRWRDVATRVHTVHGPTGSAEAWAVPSGTWFMCLFDGGSKAKLVLCLRIAPSRVLWRVHAHGVSGSKLIRGQGVNTMLSSPIDQLCQAEHQRLQAIAPKPHSAVTCLAQARESRRWTPRLQAEALAHD